MAMRRTIRIIYGRMNYARPIPKHLNGGVAIVGERGVELATMPDRLGRGKSIFSHSVTMRVLDSNLSVHGDVMTMDCIRSLIEQLSTHKPIVLSHPVQIQFPMIEPSAKDLLLFEELAEDRRRMYKLMGIPSVERLDEDRVKNVGGDCSDMIKAIEQAKKL
jgi:hypothetical protein